LDCGGQSCQARHRFRPTSAGRAPIEKRANAQGPNFNKAATVALTASRRTPQLNGAFLLRRLRSRQNILCPQIWRPSPQKNPRRQNAQGMSARIGRKRIPATAASGKTYKKCHSGLENRARFSSRVYKPEVNRGIPPKGMLPSWSKIPTMAAHHPQKRDERNETPLGTRRRLSTTLPERLG